MLVSDENTCHSFIKMWLCYGTYIKSNLGYINFEISTSVITIMFARLMCTNDFSFIKIKKNFCI